MATKRGLSRFASVMQNADADLPQKTIQPVASGLLAPSTVAPGRTWQDFAGTYGDMGGIGALSGVHNSKLFDTMTNQIAKAIGFTGNRSTPGSYQFENVNEGGTFMDTAQGVQASPEFLQALENYRFSQSPTEQFKGAITDTAGQSVGSFTTGNKDTGFDKFANTAIPLALAALGGATFGGYIPGAEIGAAGGGAASGAAAAGAADIGALGLAEGVYGAGGALGAGVAPGTVGGLAGSTAAFGGLGSVLPAGVGFAAPGALAGAAFDLSTVGGVDPAGMVPSTPQPVEFGGQGMLGEPTFTQSLSGGLEPFVAELPTIGAEATAFGGLPELSALAAGAPVETAFGSFGSGLLAPEAATAAPEVFNAAKDSQAYNAANNITAPVGTTPPATVNLVNAGGTMGTAGGLEGLLAGAKQTVSDTLGGGLLGDASAWMKANPVLGRLLMSGASGLLSGAGSGSSGGQAAAPSGPPVQWNSPLQQGLLSPVQQYAPPAIQQQRPAGLLAQGFQNDGAWRYLKG